MIVAGRSGFNPWRAWRLYLEERKLRKQIELDNLESLHQRLKNVTSDLLARANEMDQDSKLIASEMPSEWSRTLGVTCSQLVTLADQTKMIERYLQKRQPRPVRELLIGATSLAGKTGQQLRWLRINGQRKLSDAVQPNQIGQESKTFPN